ncbi:MAG TPA: nuclear transport factor 2 family protein [Candidatus Angelobacter sp.]|nr:nuclear transport factor 2 family protein [Candidatus Angelobacter sp.]
MKKRTNLDRQPIQLSALLLIWALFIGVILFFAPGGKAFSASGEKPAGAQDGGPQHGSPAGTLQATVYNLEHKLAVAEKQQDKHFFQQVLDNNLVYVAYNGLVFNKAKLLTSMKYVDVNNYSIKNLKVRSLGPQAALATYDLDINAKVAGTKLPHKQYASSVWLRNAGGWKLLFHQATPADHE